MCLIRELERYKYEEVAEGEKKEKVTFEINADTWEKFREVCALQKLDMESLINAFMQGVYQELR